MPLPTEYRAMELWHRDSGSFQYYITRIQREAALSNAPLDALYYSEGEERWILVRDLGPGHPFRTRLGLAGVEV